MNKQNHIIYKTTNLVNKKIYIGVHSQEEDPSLFDGYLGSGVAIKAAIKKYGKESFSRETLYHSFETRGEADSKEEELITDEMLKSPDCYNLIKGGGGNFSEDSLAKIKATNLKNLGSENPFGSKQIQDKIRSYNIENHGVEYSLQRESVRDKIKATNMTRYGVTNNLQIPEVKAKIKATNLKNLGSENPFGSKQIQDKIKEKMLKERGVEYISQCPVAIEKRLTTLSNATYDKYVELYPELNYIIKLIDTASNKISWEGELFRLNTKLETLKRLYKNVYIITSIAKKLRRKKEKHTIRINGVYYRIEVI